jgi:hypothetical protein
VSAHERQAAGVRLDMGKIEDERRAFQPDYDLAKKTAEDAKREAENAADMHKRVQEVREWG